ncbi:MAG: PEP-CTERM sorting domain-containing protein [Akkermansiaceae bacterium]
MRTKTITLITVAVLLTGPANAGVISFIDEDIAIPTDYAGVSVDLETGNTSVSLDGLDQTGDLNFVFGGLGFSNDADANADSPSWQPVRVGTGNTDVLRNLGVGVQVAPNSTYSSGFGGSTNNLTEFNAGEKGYVGFFLVLDDGNDTVANGWMEVTFQNNDVPGVIHSWAYDDTGAPLAVGAIPEPTQGVMLLLGLTAAAMRRRRS